MNKTAGCLTLESMGEATWYNNWLVSKFKKYLEGRILEVGCGIGNFTSELLSYGDVTAIDISKIYLEKTKKTTNGKARVGFGDIEKGQFFFKDQRFDAIVCLNVLEHIKNDRIALKNLSDLLKENGYLIIIVPAHAHLYGTIDQSIGHLRRYAKNQLLKLIAENGLEIVTAKRLNFLGALGWWFSGKILRRAVVDRGKIKMFNLIAPSFLKLENIMETPIGISLLIIAQKI